jgi:NADH dehydrogenase
LLGALPEDLAEHARESLERLGVEVRLNAPVSACDVEGVVAGGERIGSRCVIWAAGVQASPVARWLGVAGDRAGRVSVGADMSVEGDDRVFVIGDCALAMGDDGKPLPGVAPVAKQQGAYVADCILGRIEGRAAEAFRYRDYGSMATIGRKAAIADFRGLHLRGVLGWLVWCAAHVYFLIGFRNRVAVALDWVWSYLTFERGARLITGTAVPDPPASDVAREAA